MLTKKWKVRAMGQEGLTEVEFAGSLGEVAETFKDVDVRVVQFAGFAEVGGQEDAARGSDSVIVDKTDVGALPSGLV